MEFNNKTAEDNFSKPTENHGCCVEVESYRNGICQVNVLRDIEHLTFREKINNNQNSPKNIIYLNSNIIGDDDGDIGKILMHSFINTLMDVAPQPEKIICINKGVLLTTEGSEVLEALIRLAERGTQILSCGTCLDYFELNDKLKIGAISNMYEIVSILLKADKIITP